MPRRSANTTSPNLPFFPFIAVFICTAGALAPLVYGYEWEGRRLQAEISKVLARKSQVDEINVDRESIEWRVSMLQQSREKTQRNLADQQLELSHVEDHLRRLREQASQLQLAAEELERQGGARSQQTANSAAELQRLRLAIAAAERARKEDSQADGDQPATFSVVPYEGPNQTKRRPIYIECRGDQVIIQPEGIVLRESDFELPLGPGNPLAASIRAYGEYLNRAGLTGETTRPYPMLLVRPDGINSYYAARAALTFWGTEFGYELVGEDWKLDFPPAEPPLVEQVQQVIADARIRKEALAIAAPRQFKRPRTALRASRNGGFVAEGDDQGGSRFGGSGYASRQGRGRGFGESGQSDGNDWRTGSSSGGGIGGNAAEARNGELGFENDPAGGIGMGSDRAGPGFGQHSSQGANGLGGGDPTGRPPGGDSETGPNGEGLSEGNSTSTGLAGAEQANAGGPRYGQPAGSGNGPMGNTAAGQPGQRGTSDTKNELGPLGSAGQGYQANSKPAAAGNAGGSPSNGSSAASSSSASAGGSGAGGEDSSTASPQASATMGAPPPKQNRPKSIASSRGRDWGLPEGSTQMTPVTRPVIIRCEPNQLTIMPDDARSLPKSIPMGSRTQDSVDKLVSGVWDHMKDWGLAGRGMYWRPTLAMEVAPGGEARFQELQALLQDSGMEVKQRQRPSAEGSRR